VLNKLYPFNRCFVHIPALPVRTVRTIEVAVGRMRVEQVAVHIEALQGRVDHTAEREVDLVRTEVAARHTSVEGHGHTVTVAEADHTTRVEGVARKIVEVEGIRIPVDFQELVHTEVGSEDLD